MIEKSRLVDCDEKGRKERLRSRGNEQVYISVS